MLLENFHLFNIVHQIWLDIQWNFLSVWVFFLPLHCIHFKRLGNAWSVHNTVQAKSNCILLNVLTYLIFNQYCSYSCHWLIHSNKINWTLLSWGKKQNKCECKDLITKSGLRCINPWVKYIVKTCMIRGQMSSFPLPAFPFTHSPSALQNVLYYHSSLDSF